MQQVFRGLKSKQFTHDINWLKENLTWHNSKSWHFRGNYYMCLDVSGDSLTQINFHHKSGSSRNGRVIELRLCLGRKQTPNICTSGPKQEETSFSPFIMYPFGNYELSLRLKYFWNMYIVPYFEGFTRYSVAFYPFSLGSNKSWLLSQNNNNDDNNNYYNNMKNRN